MQGRRDFLIDGALKDSVYQGDHFSNNFQYIRDFNESQVFHIAKKIRFHLKKLRFLQRTTKITKQQESNSKIPIIMVIICQITTKTFRLLMNHRSNSLHSKHWKIVEVNLKKDSRILKNLTNPSSQHDSKNRKTRK